MTESPTFLALAVIATVLTSAASSPHADAPAGRYSLVEGDTAVKDTKTGLVWMRKELSGTYTWANAQTACATVPGGGFRLPNIIELSSLVDRAKTAPTIDTSVFQGPTGGAPTSNFFWSSSSFALSAGDAWNVSFGSGTVSSGLGADYRCAVRCVR